MAPRPVDDDVRGMVIRHKRLSQRRTALNRELARLITVFETQIAGGIRQCLTDPSRYIPALLADPPVYPDHHALALLLNAMLTVERELSDLTKRLQGAGVDVVLRQLKARRRKKVT